MIFNGCGIIGSLSVGPDVTVPLGYVLQTFQMDPSALDARLGVESQLWDNYRFRKYVVHYVPIVSKLEPGQIVAYYDADTLDADEDFTGITAIQVASSHRYNVAFSVAEQTSLPIAPDCFAKSLFIRSSDESLLQNQGFIRFLWSGGDLEGPKVFGMVYVEYEIEFFNPSLQPVGFVAPSSLLTYEGTESRTTNPDFYFLDEFSTEALQAALAGTGLSAVLHNFGQLGGENHNIIKVPKGVDANVALKLDLGSTSTTASSFYDKTRWSGCYLIPAAVLDMWTRITPLATTTLDDSYPHSGYLTDDGYWYRSIVNLINNSHISTSSQDVPLVVRRSSLADIMTWYSQTYGPPATPAQMAEGDLYLLPTLYEDTINTAGSIIQYSMFKLIVSTVLSLGLFGLSKPISQSKRMSKLLDSHLGETSERSSLTDDVSSTRVGSIELPKVRRL
jgi:hypothetical protein